MRRPIFIALAAASAVLTAVPLAGAAAAAQTTADPPASNIVPGVYLVTLNHTPDLMAAANKLAAKYGGKVGFDFAPLLPDTVELMVPGAKQETLAADSAVTFVEPDETEQGDSEQGNPQNDDPAPYNLDRIDQVRERNGYYVFPASAGAGVNIYILDSGVSPTMDLGTRLSAPSDAVFCSGCVENVDQFGHGTLVAGLAAGTRWGVAKEATIISVRVLNQNNSGDTASAIAGMNYVARHHVNGGKDVANMSFSDRNNPPLQNEAAANLTAAGVHVVASAGNDANNACTYSPASVPSVITVGSTERYPFRELSTGRYFDPIASFSGRGPCVTIFAPGRDVLSDSNTDPWGTSGRDSGTSFSAPEVAGTVALIIAKSGNQTPSAMKDTIVRLGTSGVLTGLGNSGSPDLMLRVPTP